MSPSRNDRPAGAGVLPPAGASPADTGRAEGRAEGSIILTKISLGDGGQPAPRTGAPRIDVIGAGVAGLCAATALAEAGAQVRLIDRDPDPRGASWLAGGMLAPFCEGESAPAEVVACGADSIAWWSAHAAVTHGGTLVVAPARDRAELDRFAARTEGWQWLDAEAIAALEPDLAGRFDRALFFASEAHLDPRDAMADLRARLDFAPGATPDAPLVVDCRGWSARDMLPDLRPVRGEMLEIASSELRLNRTVRVLHPRFPCYLVPRAGGRIMVGGTMVESADDGPVTARAVMELLSAAYTLHPALAEARLLATGAGLRPSFPDNLPQIRQAGGRWHVNGFYRHGFLMAPIMAQQLTDTLIHEVRHAS